MLISRRGFVAAAAALPFTAHVYAQTYPVRRDYSTLSPAAEIELKID